MKKIFHISIYIILTGFFSKVLAQTNPNLVQNSSFENYSQCPIANFNSFFVTGWNQVTFQGRTSDYFNVCNNVPNGNGDMGVPNNLPNNNTATGLNPNTGVVYSGILTKESSNLIEYIYTAVQLTANIQYDISFYVSLASTSEYATPIMVALSQNSLITSNNPINNLSNATLLTTGVIDNAGTWQQVSFEMTPNASGTYYIMIGNFSTSNSQISVTNDFSTDQGYYYIDDVVIKEHAGCCPDNLTIDNTTLSSTHIFGANNTITVGPNVDVTPGANITFVANGQITFLPGFSGGPNVSALIGECPGQFQQVSNSPIATIITPDGDGILDEVCVNILGSTTWSVEVTGLLGQLVYTNGGPVDEAPECIWDGTCNNGAVCNNAVLPAAFYIITLTLVDCNGEPFEFNYLVQLQYPGLRIASTNPEVIDSVLNSELKIFPNPASNNLFIEFPVSGNEGHSISIFDSQGRIALFKNSSENENKVEIDLSAFANGIYFIQIKNTDGKTIGSEKIIKAD